jgi:hypothetical protein
MSHGNWSTIFCSLIGLSGENMRLDAPPPFEFCLEKAGVRTQAFSALNLRSCSAIIPSSCGSLQANLPHPGHVTSLFANNIPLASASLICSSCQTVTHSQQIVHVHTDDFLRDITPNSEGWWREHNVYALSNIYESPNLVIDNHRNFGL